MVASPAIPAHPASLSAALPASVPVAGSGDAAAGPLPDCRTALLDRTLPPPPDRPAFWQGTGWLARLWRPNRRVSPRLSLLRGTVRVNGTMVLLGDLSRGGMKLVGYRGMLDRQDRFDFTLCALCDGAAPDGGDLTLELAGEAIVAWRRGDRMGAAFYRMDPEHRTQLTHLLAVMASRLEG